MFDGFVRDNGDVGTRNYLLILGVTGLTAPIVRRLGALMPQAVTLATTSGSGLIGDDKALHHCILKSYATHPNVGGVLVLGHDERLVRGVADAAAEVSRPHEALIFDELGHDALVMTERGLKAALHLQHSLSRLRREPCDTRHIFMGGECGRSDPSSGLVANPLVGLIADRIVDAGGRAVIGETTEWLGAEHLLAERASSPELAQAIIDAALRREQMAIDAGIDMTGANPGQTNIDAGLSSIEEKSLGAIAKSGSRPITGLLSYGERPAQPGLYVMDQGSYAPESVSGFVAAGANLVLFTTGVGNAYGSALAPTLKISGNPETAARLGHQLDFDASTAFRGERSLEALAEALETTMLDIASGSLAWSEALGETNEAFTRLGPSF
ncbi:MAG: UxaA family hydrolase [Pseudomonadota bacterium]